MKGRYALDTNIVIALVDGDLAVREQIATADEIFIPCPVLGELFFGAFRSSQPEKNVSRIDDLARSFVVLSIDEGTAKIYGRLQNELRAKGTPIPMNDVWIAALASQWNATVVTRDDHFSQLSGIVSERW
jgi:tRNA(fMet)-specific endonuclease VapC